MNTILIILLVLFLLFGGGFGFRRWGGRGLGGVVAMVLIILLVMWLTGDFRHQY